MTFTPIFLDLETTGKDENKGCILEVGLLALEPGTLQEAAAWSCPVLPPSGWQGMCSPEALALHEASGLRALLTGPASYLKLEAGGLPSLKQVEEWACYFVAQHSRGELVPMCGANVSGFDRRWLRVHAPKLDAAFHYRSLDTNALWLAERLALGEPAVKTGTAHRALADCRQAAEVLRQHVARVRAAARV